MKKHQLFSDRLAAAEEPQSGVDHVFNGPWGADIGGGIYPFQLPCLEIKGLTGSQRLKIMLPSRQIIAANKARPYTGRVVVDGWSPHGYDAFGIAFVLQGKALIASGGRCGKANPSVEAQGRMAVEQRVEGEGNVGKRLFEGHSRGRMAFIVGFRDFAGEQFHLGSRIKGGQFGQVGSVKG